jgi:hypothetical protein
LVCNRIYVFTVPVYLFIYLFIYLCTRLKKATCAVCRNVFSVGTPRVRVLHAIAHRAMFDRVAIDTGLRVVREVGGFHNRVGWKKESQCGPAESRYRQSISA